MSERTLRVWLYMLSAAWVLGFGVLIYGFSYIHDSTCRNGSIIADGLQQQLVQARDPQVYRQFFPDIPRAQLRAVRVKQIQQLQGQIDKLRTGC